MDDIYAAKKACHDKDKKSFETQAPGTFSNDKWNPGDIWMSTFPTTDNPLKDFTSTWGELNNKIAELAGAFSSTDKTKLLGISLKKLSGKGTLKEYKKPGRNSVDSYTFKGYKYGKTGDFFKSQDIYFETSADEIQFRTFQETVSQAQVRSPFLLVLFSTSRRGFTSETRGIFLSALSPPISKSQPRNTKQGRAGATAH